MEYKRPSPRRNPRAPQLRLSREEQERQAKKQERLLSQALVCALLIAAAMVLAKVDTAATNSLRGKLQTAIAGDQAAVAVSTLQTWGTQAKESIGARLRGEENKTEQTPKEPIPPSDGGDGGGTDAADTAPTDQTPAPAFPEDEPKNLDPPETPLPGN